MIFQKNTIKNSSKGFTLIETLVSLLIFSVSIVALISITAGGVSDTNFVKKKQSAYLLAQEGVELVRNIRDTALRSEISWVTFLSDPDVAANCVITQQNPVGCTIDSYLLAQGNSISSALSACANNVCPELRRETTPASQTSGFYQYMAGPDSGYTRTIKIQKVFNGHPGEKEVISEVSWEHGGNTSSVTMSEIITSWVKPIPN
jgi:prepilin-type N-terminal cleavage/methylation domain-containing protein